MVILSSSEVNMILVALEEKRVQYQHFAAQARKHGNLDFVKKWSQLEKDHMDLICNLVEGREAGDIA